MSEKLKRKLTTILAADAAQFSRHMERDEAGTYAALSACRQIFAASIARHDGRIANTAGDGLIADFASPVEAVSCAIEIQRELAGADTGPQKLDFRIGLHLGDVIVDGGDLLGDGVNLAARLQSMADPGGILMSQQVYDQVRQKLSVTLEPLGEKRPRNFSEDIPVYRISPPKQPRLRRFGFGASSDKSGAKAAWLPQDLAPLEQSTKVLGLANGGVLLADLATGPGSFFPLAFIPSVGWLGWQVADLRARTPAQRNRYRIVAGLACVTLLNIFTWSGTLWAFWPIAAFLIWNVMRRRREASGD